MSVSMENKPIMNKLNNSIFKITVGKLMILFVGAFTTMHFVVLITPGMHTVNLETFIIAVFIVATVMVFITYIYHVNLAEKLLHMRNDGTGLTDDQIKDIVGEEYFKKMQFSTRLVQRLR